MLKKVFSYGAVEAVSKGLNKLTLLVLPLLLDVSNYGKIGLLVSVETILPLISFLGFDRVVLRFYSEKKDIKSFEKTIFSSVSIVHFLLLLFVLLIFFTGVRQVFGIEVFPDLFFLTCLVFLQGVNGLYLNILRVSEEHKLYYYCKMSFQVLKFIAVIILVCFFDSYLGYIYGSLFASFMLFVFFKFRSYTPNQSLSYEKKTFRKFFFFSWPFIFHGVSMNLLGNADKFVIESFLSVNAVGKYTLIYAIGSSISFAFIGVSVFIEPLIYKEKDDLRREVLFDKFTIYTLISGVFMYFVLGLISQFVLPNIYNDSYNKVLSFIPLIASAYIVFPYYLKANYRLTYSESTKSIALISFLSTLINIGLNIVFIPIYGIYAAVVITILSFIIQSIVFTIVSNTKDKIIQETSLLFFLSSITIFLLFFKIDYYIGTVFYLSFVLYLISKKGFKWLL